MTTVIPERADILIRRAYIVTLDPQNRVLSDGAIAITGKRITWIGTSNEAKKIVAAEVIDAYGHIVLPGMVDAHFHTGQQLLRGKLA